MGFFISGPVLVCLLDFSSLALTFPLFSPFQVFLIFPLHLLGLWLILNVALQHHPVHWSAPPSPASLRARFYSSLVWPPCLQMGMEFEWPSWKRMGPISLFPVTILGPDTANHLALEESNLPDATLSFPQNLHCLNQPGFSFFPLLCQIFALHLGKPIIHNVPKVLYFYLMDSHSSPRNCIVSFLGGFL